VRKEIEFAFNHNKTIIPVFVNGASGFPIYLPTSISYLTNQNGIYFRHDNFEDSITVLIDQIKTRRDQLIDSFFALDENKLDYDTVVLNLKYFNDEFGEGTSEWAQMQKLITDHYRKCFKRINMESINAIERIFSEYDTSNLKDMCRKLGLDSRGDKKAIFESFYCFVSNSTLQRIEDEDRMETLVYSFRSTKDISLSDVRETLEKIYKCNERNTHDLIRSCIYENTVKDVLSNFSEKYLKDIAWRCIGNETGRKQEIIEKINGYVNYQDYE
jgi:hypothetical protein